MQLADILTNPVTQRLSQSKFCIAVALVATTFALVWEVVHGRATEWLYGLYLAAWVTHAQASKRAAISRDALTTPKGGEQ
ncbi:hypothetical protein [uncultured Aquitalea sp.]|uniref:hypothetical protein n=1 Tax=uncultured Aquitalea sp. TaxID=540272 RepID=UPI0025E971E4|nr:hypothetical protein [uncultured Aquitalea sp.]